jgi:hypothetical protein
VCVAVFGSNGEMGSSHSFVAIGFHPGKRPYVSTSFLGSFAFGCPVASDNLFFFKMLSVGSACDLGFFATSWLGMSPSISLFFVIALGGSGGSSSGSGRQSLDPDPHPYSRLCFFLRAVLFLSSQDWYFDFLSAGILLAPTWLAAFAQSGKQ